MHKNLEMKIRILYIFLFSTLINNAQNKDCEFTTQVTDSLGTYKSLPEYLVYEKKFGGKEDYLFFSLANTNDTPFLKFQLVQKSKDFIKAFCLDINSKLYFQLNNGKIITMVHTSDESCGTLINLSEENLYSRISTGIFLFLKGSLEDLKSSPITLMRLKNTTENIDYIFKSSFKSELTNQIHFPENYFVNYLKCVE